MSLIDAIKREFLLVIKIHLGVEDNKLSNIELKLNVDKEKEFGDLSCNVALILAKELKEKPKDIAQKVVDFFDQSSQLKNKPTQWVPNPDELLENKEFWEAFSKCRKKLPQKASDAFTLKEIEKVNSKEICEILKISSSNFWVLLHRARLQLRECLEENWFNK